MGANVAGRAAKAGNAPDPVRAIRRLLLSGLLSELLRQPVLCVLNLATRPGSLPILACASI